MRNTIIRPPVLVGSTVVHGRPVFGDKTASEQGYFTRYATGVKRGKPEVRS